MGFPIRFHMRAVVTGFLLEEGRQATKALDSDSDSVLVYYLGAHFEFFVFVDLKVGRGFWKAPDPLQPLSFTP